MNYVRTVILQETPKELDIERGSLKFIGNATVLLRYAGFTILTDPNFLHRGEYAHLGFGIKAERVMDPAMEMKNVPPLDIVVLSHLHEDHFDREVSNKLNKSTPIVTTPQAAKELRKQHFYKIYALKTWESLTLVKTGNQLRITSMPGKHGPWLVAKVMPEVMGSMLEFTTAQKKVTFRLYISGDTLVYKDLKEIPKRYPEIDAALVHLGGTKVFGIIVTMDAKQGVEAVKIINPREAIPIHCNDYDRFTFLFSDFKTEVTKAGLEQRIRYLRHGDTYNFEVPVSRR
jgi:L-ascorbate metabolism protein UlaG (beta-lactamase superfamily)